MYSIHHFFGRNNHSTTFELCRKAHFEELQMIHLPRLVFPFLLLHSYFSQRNVSQGFVYSHFCSAHFYFLSQHCLLQNTLILRKYFNTSAFIVEFLVKGSFYGQMHIGSTSSLLPVGRYQYY